MKPMRLGHKILLARRSRESPAGLSKDPSPAGWMEHREIAFCVLGRELDGKWQTKIPNHPTHRDVEPNC